MESLAGATDVAPGIEESMYKLAVDLINQTNRPLKIGELFALATSRLGLTAPQANAAIYGLIKKKVIVEGSKLTYQDILANPLRSQIADYITKNPGSHVRDIRRAMNIDNAESAWHLKMLEKFGLLRSKRFGKYLAYYPANLAESAYDEILCTIRQDTTYRVLYDVFSTPNTALPEISQRLGMNPSTVQYHVDKLLKLNVIYAASDPATNGSRFTVNSEVWGGILQIAPGFSG
ncbi:MAG: winged helix-turn-helix transcriptional regulator [Candidatus Lokiarchaeota archaeon]|nr:winged helix-turn-helix transcriptional regulator [Candidatus Lokiarchaeota archaeon]